MRIVLLGSVNPKDFGDQTLSVTQLGRVRFGRSMPVVDLAESLVTQGNQVLVISLASGLLKPITLEAHRGLEIRFVPARRREKIKALTFYKKERSEIIKAIADFQPEMVHAHWTYEYALAAQDSGFPHLITAHDAPWEIFKDFRNLFFFLRYLMAILVRVRSSSEMVYVSHFILKKWKRQLFIRNGIVIPNMVSLDAVSGVSKEKGKSILSVGNANRGKNIHLLLDAWTILSRKNFDYILHIVGPDLGPNDYLAKRYQGRGGMDRVIWHGNLDRQDLNNLYRGCQILVHPSLHESFGLVFLEAFTYELAVIALEQAGGTREVLGDAGLLLNSSDALLLSDAIYELASNPEKIRVLAARGKERLPQYLPTKITLQYSELYGKVIEKYVK